MDALNKGLIAGGPSVVIVLAATRMLAGVLEQNATEVVDETYSPAREATVDYLGWPIAETPRGVREDAEFQAPSQTPG
jgi:hypothetical protein